MEKNQKRPFYKEKQNINVLKTLLPSLMSSLVDNELVENKLIMDGKD